MGGVTRYKRDDWVELDRNGFVIQTASQTARQSEGHKEKMIPSRNFLIDF